MQYLYMDKSAILKGFNNQFEEFLEDIEILFPENHDIKTSKWINNVKKQTQNDYISMV